MIHEGAGSFSHKCVNIIAARVQLNFPLALPYPTPSEGGWISAGGLDGSLFAVETQAFAVNSRKAICMSKSVRSRNGVLRFGLGRKVSSSRFVTM